MRPKGWGSKHQPVGISVRPSKSPFVVAAVLVFPIPLVASPQVEKGEVEVLTTTTRACSDHPLLRTTSLRWQLDRPGYGQLKFLLL